MPAFTSERRNPNLRGAVPSSGERRQQYQDAMARSKSLNEDEDHDANRDPITGAPGSHPVGTGVGAAAGGLAAGAAAGSFVGPVGTLIGAAVGAIAGGLAGKGVAEKLDPTAEEAYWKENYDREPYYERGYAFDDYHPAYRTGWEGRVRYAGKDFDDVQRELEADFKRNRGQSKLGWDKSRHATRAAWDRLPKDWPFEKS